MVFLAEKNRGDRQYKELHGLQAQHRQVGRDKDSWEDKVYYYYGNDIPKMTRNEILKLNKTGNARINLAGRWFRVTIIVLEK